MFKYNKKCFNTFRVFSDFLERTFNGVTTYEIASMYRDCFGIGRGYITNEIFHAVANE